MYNVACDLNCSKTCLNCFFKKCEDSIFYQIQNYASEMTEEDFDDLVHDIEHSEVDEAVTYAFHWDVQTMVEQYGLLRALQMYEDEMGGSSNLIMSARDGKEDVLYRTLLYWIVQQNIEITWACYQDYCREHPIC